MPTSDAATFCATLVDEWVRAGLDTAFVAPGSRSTPLALALSANDAMTIHLFHDERAASFAALGHGLATSKPGVVLCTSGTAAAHFHAAVIEADLASVPMLICTGDRPPELWDIGAPQTIDQSRLYGSTVRYFAEPGVPDAAAADSWRSLASRSVAEALGWSGRPGPVHLNLSFRDPLVAEPGPLQPGRPDTKSWHQVSAAVGSILPRSTAIAPIVADVASKLWREDAGEPGDSVAVDGVIVAGAGSPEPDLILALAERLGWPVLADHRSRCRAGANAITHFDALLRCPDFTAAFEPDLVLRFGEGLASKALTQWLDGASANLVAVVDGTRWSDPERIATTMLHGSSVASQLLSALPGELQPAMTAERWIAADEGATQAVDTVLASHATSSDSHVGYASEIEIARSVVGGITPGGALVVSSSMPVRDVEWYGPNRNDIDVFSNRGANGIDGVVSTAIGVALSGQQTTVLIGDVAFLHDSTALIALARRAIDLHIVVVDNDGGGIFSFLPQAKQLDHDTYEQLFGTPHGTDLAALAGAHNITTRAFTPTPPTKGGVTISLAASNREKNTELHDRLNKAVADTVTSGTD